MSEPEIVSPTTTSVDGNNVDEVAPAKVQTPKRTPSKRKTFVERAQAESEQLLKSMGINVEGGTPGRRTRSGGARNSPVVPVESPAKKAKTTTPKAKGRGKKLLDAIVVEKDEESAQDNSIESQKDEVPVEKESHEEDKVDSVSTDVIPEEKKEEPVPKEEAAEPTAVPEEESPVEAMEVDTAPTIILTPPEPEIQEVESADSTAAPVEETEELKEDPAEDINAAQENELNTAEEIKQNETNSSEESKVTQNEELLSEEGTNNHVTTDPEEESVPVEQTETSGHCQTETEPPAANSDIVQTPQSCN